MIADPAAHLEELRTKLAARRTAMEERINSLMNDVGDTELPPLEQLQGERVRLIQEIQHSKDEGDAVVRELEHDEVASNVFRVGARVQRLERFIEHSQTYLEKDLPAEIEKINEADRRHSQDEVGGYVNELQKRKQEELRRIAALEERTKKCAMTIRRGLRVDAGARNSRRFSSSKPDQLTDEDVKTVGYIQSQRGDNSEMEGKLKELKEKKSKLQLEILDQRHKHEKEVNELKILIRRAEIAAKADERLCRELNTGNANLTTNSRILLGQLNGEYYGIRGGPSRHEIKKFRQDVERALKNRPVVIEDMNTKYNVAAPLDEARAFTESPFDHESEPKADNVEVDGSAPASKKTQSVSDSPRAVPPKEESVHSQRELNEDNVQDSKREGEATHQ